MTTSWLVDALFSKIGDKNFDKAVSHVSWRCLAELDVDGVRYCGEISGTCFLDEPSHQDFVSYNSLTEDIVLAWIWDGKVSKSDVEKAVAAQIANQISPEIAETQLPWI